MTQIEKQIAQITKKQVRVFLEFILRFHDQLDAREHEDQEIKKTFSIKFSRSIPPLCSFLRPIICKERPLNICLDLELDWNTIASR
jgi:hypothetical protein